MFNVDTLYFNMIKVVKISFNYNIIYHFVHIYRMGYLTFTYVIFLPSCASLCTNNSVYPHCKLLRNILGTTKGNLVVVTKRFTFSIYISL